MWPDWVLNPGPLAHESDALPNALSEPAHLYSVNVQWKQLCCFYAFILSGKYLPEKKFLLSPGANFL